MNIRVKGKKVKQETGKDWKEKIPKAILTLGIPVSKTRQV
jgi:hypothetical protein